MHLYRKMQNKSIFTFGLRHLDPNVNVCALNPQYELGDIYSKEPHKYKHHQKACGTDFTIRTETNRFASQTKQSFVLRE